jgi:uncharacterized protein YdeI (YjbR/CyaY-like superfamily)
MAKSSARPDPIYFTSPQEFRNWLEEHAASATECVVGFMKRGTGAPSMTWPESVDEALCFGWIDGVRQRVDDERYKIRFTPRKAGSVWSSINIERVAVLMAEGRLKPGGLAAFEKRIEKKSRIYSYEQTHTPELDPGELKSLKKNKAAFAFFEALPSGYRKQMIWRIVSAKRLETRAKRFAIFLQSLIDGKRID